ncbi:MAG: S-layer homology domain-containing protein [Actinomycetota bacterium]
MAVVSASPVAAATTRYVDQNGGGSSCTSSAPCASFDAALRVAQPGDLIRVRGGEYPVQHLERSVSWGADAANVSFEAYGGPVRVEEIRSEVPSLTFRGFSVGVLYFDAGADANQAINNRVEQAFVTSADGTGWFGNTIKPAVDGPDAMQIKARNGDQPVGVTIIGNTFGPQWRAGSSHTDCIQILGGDDILIERNTMLPCADKALQIRSGVTGVIGTVRIVANVIGECAPRRDQCNGFHAAIVAAEGNRIEFIHNSINGSVALSESGSRPGGSDNVVFYGNIADLLPCTSRSDFNLVASGPCGPNDVVDTPIWRNDDELTQDLHLVRGSPGIEVGSPYAPSIDIDGQRCTSGDLGADQTCGSGGAQPGSELERSVAWMYANGITAEGPHFEKFDANGVATRAHAVTFLHRAHGSPSDQSPLPSDVGRGVFYTNSVQWGIANGVVAGFPDGTFRPYEIVTRGQFVTLLWRLAGSPRAPQAAIPDVPAGAYYAEAVAWAQQEGVMFGYQDGTFRPDESIIRGHIAMLLCRFSAVESFDATPCG